MHETPDHPRRPSALASGWRYALAGVGILFVGIGAVGAFLPGLPTTIFLIIASACFAKSCPWLEDRFLNTRLFRPYMRIVNGERAMTRREKLGTLAIMWTFVSISVVLLAMGDSPNLWLVFTVVLAALVGTVFIIHWKGRRAPVVDSGVARCPARSTWASDETVAKRTDSGGQD